MPRSDLIFTGLAACVLIAMFAGECSAGSFEFGELPKAPLANVKPTVHPAELEGRDLSKIDPEALHRAARASAADRNYPRAVQLQYWAVKEGVGDRYDLACYEAMAGDKEAAFYWLQEAALNEGVDTVWAKRDPDLEALRKDLRWKKVSTFLNGCNAYWEASGLTATSLILPAGYKPGTPIGAIVGLHGMGSDPTRFVNDSWQVYADELNRAIIGVSGTIPRGGRKFVWSEDPVKDAERIRTALKEVADRVVVKPGDVVLFGFSQGAQMAFEAALSYPDEFRGAIVISPGPAGETRLAGFESSPENRGQGYVCVCGEGEHPRQRRLHQGRCRDRAPRRGENRPQALRRSHRARFPPDFHEKFVDWVKFIAVAVAVKSK